MSEIKRGETKNFKEKIEYFLYEDDSFSATAGKFLLMTLALDLLLFRQRC